MKQETSLELLRQFLPEQTFDYAISFFRQYEIHLTLTKERKSVFGDYRTPTKAYPAHRISLNITLNPYQFLVTLLHELAHLITWQQFGRKAAPHGAEWKAVFVHVLIPVTKNNMLPEAVTKALLQYMASPAASTCSDPKLYKVLQQFTRQRVGWKYIDELTDGQRFALEDGREFTRLNKMRTRIRCREDKTGLVYFFQPVAEGKVLD